MRSDFLTTGPVVQEFERSFADVTGAQEAIVCANGTAALHLASLAAGLDENTTVIVPSLTFLATANGPYHAGARVVFADVDAETGLMTPDTLRDAINRAGTGLRAIFPVHLNGHAADMAAIGEIARQSNCIVIEDAPHALGGSYLDGGSIGSCTHGDMATFSLHPAKSVAMGEGGVITTNDADTAETLRRLRNHGMERDPERWQETELAWDESGDPNPWYYEMRQPGFNYRASDINCALGLSQLAKLGQFLERRRKIADRYFDAFARLGNIACPVSPHATGQSGWHLFVLRINFDLLGQSRATLMRKLADRGVGTQVHYIPVHRQPYWRARYPDLSLPGADAYYNNCLSIPFYPAMSDEDVDYVIREILSALTV